MGQSTMARSSTISDKESEYRCGLTTPNMKDSGKKIVRGATESSPKRMETCMRGNGWTIMQTATEYL